MKTKSQELRIACWNVNSITARLDRVRSYVSRVNPDILCLQELKTVEEKFPVAEFEELGYKSSIYGQKTYNGVAILSNVLPISVQKGLGCGGELDEQARVIRADFKSLSIINVYAPNGQAVDSDKYSFKLRWYKQFREYLKECLTNQSALLVLGDFNIAPEDKDVFDPIAWRESILCSTAERSALHEILALGFYDALRLHHQESGIYSWWDYRQLSFPRNNGLRIDLCLISKTLVSKCLDSGIDREERKGPQPSDHAPIWVDIQK